MAINDIQFKGKVRGDVIRDSEVKLGRGVRFSTGVAAQCRKCAKFWGDIEMRGRGGPDLAVHSDILVMENGYQSYRHGQTPWQKKWNIPECGGKVELIRLNKPLREVNPEFLKGR